MKKLKLTHSDFIVYVLWMLLGGFGGYALGWAVAYLATKIFGG